MPLYTMKEILKDAQVKRYAADMNVLCVGIAVCVILLQPIPKDIMHRGACFIGKPTKSTGGAARFPLNI